MKYPHARYRLLKRRLTRRINSHPRIAALILMVVVIGLSGLILLTLKSRALNTDDARIVILSADHKVITLPTREPTVGDFLTKAEVTIHNGDVVEPSLDTLIQEDNFHINVYRAAPVIVYDGTSKLFGLSAALTPRSMAEQVGVQLYPEDNVITEASDDFLRNGSIGNKLVIDRATPVNLNMYGASFAIRTQAQTVGEFLKEKNVQVAADDTVKPALDTPISSALQVFVIRNGIQVVTAEQEVVPPSETVQDSSLSFGTTVLRQKGIAGKKSVTYQIEIKDGVEVSRKVIQEVIVQEPVKEIIARGQAVTIPSDKEAVMRSAGIVESDFPYVYYIINHENALWCPTRWQGQNSCPAFYQEKYPGAETDTKLGYGLCQSTPAIKMASAGSDWRTNAVTQLKWCASYAQNPKFDAYGGGWLGAYNYWLAKHFW